MSKTQQMVESPVVEKIEITPTIDINKKLDKKEFLDLDAKTACLFAFNKYKKKEWSLKNFDDSLRAWWRNRHGNQQELTVRGSPIVEKELEETVGLIESLSF